MTSSPAQALFVMSAEGRSGKSLIALGLVDSLARRVGRVGVFRPVVEDADAPDEVIDLLARRSDPPLPSAVGVSYDDVHGGVDAAMASIVERYHALAEQCDAVVVVGSDYSEVASPIELGVNARIAANLGVPVVAVVNGRGRALDSITHLVDLTVNELRHAHATALAVVVNRVDPEALDAVREGFEDRQTGGAEPVGVRVVPEDPLVGAPQIVDALAAVDGTLIAGDNHLLNRVYFDTLVCGMNVEHVLDYLADGQLCIVAGDRSDVLVALAASCASAGAPTVSAVVLTGGFVPDANVARLLAGIDAHLPLISTELDSFDTAGAIAGTHGRLSRASTRKIHRALATFEDHLGADVIEVLGAIPRTNAVTPLMFELQLIDLARAAGRHIVLPEGEEDRILQAAATLRARNVARLTLLGEPAVVRSRAAALGLRLDDVDIINPSTSERREEYARIYTELRAHRGMTLDPALDIMRDVSYFGTMMVHLGHADGMVSGAAHSTAHTVTPSFEIIKTSPGVDVVSSVFFMCLPDQVLVYGDCAVLREPTVEQLADIAIASAGTAARFGVDPRIAMLSYSTGESGSGEDVEKVRAATRLVRERRPDLKVDGPVQYDAAIDADVAASKMPGSEVAGRATVLIFPDLNTGNNTYKAVQRSAGAIAIGPVLQGLAKPINDLSRGATVRDIVNTVAITAAQAAPPEQEEST
jgi:phosphate acetyltransferase